MRTHAAECAVDFPGMAMQELVDRYGALLVFANVLALSLGLPVPAMPTLVLVGAGLALQPEAMWLPLLGVLAVSVAASLIGDSVWFYAGRRYGNRTLQSLCRLSLSRDTCMKRTERFYGRFGVRVLSVAKFIPGLSMVSVPLAGAMQARLPLFLRYDGLGAALWAALGLGLGVVFARQVETVIDALSQLGTGAGVVIGVLLAAYVGWRWWRRRTLLRSLEGADRSAGTRSPGPGGPAAGGVRYPRAGFPRRGPVRHPRRGVRRRAPAGRDPGHVSARREGRHLLRLPG